MQINGGTGAENGCDFIRTADGNWRVNGYDDLPTYTELGVTTLVVDESAVFTDASDIDSDPVTAPYDGIVEAMQGAAFDGFYADNTTVTIQSGRVVRIDRYVCAVSRHKPRNGSGLRWEGRSRSALDLPAETASRRWRTSRNRIRSGFGNATRKILPNLPTGLTLGAV